MRVSQEEKDRSHARIVTAAARLLRERGVEGASVGDVMTTAGLTHGGFYRHFETKDALVSAALKVAFDEFMAPLDARLKNGEPRAAVEQFIATYLSDGHVEHPEFGCPMPALGAEIGRGAAALKSEFGAGVERVVASLARGKRGDEPERRKQAARQLAMLAGAVLIARASDPETGRAMLEACRTAPND
jgi:TetR/AcrR family transcriptional repressor of nem operon